MEDQAKKIEIVTKQVASVTDEKISASLVQTGSPTTQVESFKFFFCMGIAIAILFLAFSGASSLQEGGENIGRISSVGGRTMEERYYTNLELIYTGFAYFVRAFGIFGAGLFAYLGFKK